MVRTSGERVDTKFAQALQVLVFVSETQRTASSQALAQSVNTNASHIRKITGMLKQAGIVESRQGKAGFVLARPAKDITLDQVYRAVYPSKALLHVHPDPNPECPVGRSISQVLQPVFVEAEDCLLQHLSHQTLAQLVASLYEHARHATIHYN